MRSTWKSYGAIAATVIGTYLLIRFFPSVYAGAGMLFRAMIPLLAGCAIAYVVNILMSFYEHCFKKICRNAAIDRHRRVACMFLAFLSIFLVLVVLWQLIVPQLLACFSIVFERFPQVLDVLYHWLEEHFQIERYMSDNIRSWMDQPFRWESLIRKLPAAIKSMQELLRILGKWTISLLVAIVFAVYILVAKERLLADLSRLARSVFPSGFCNRASYVIHALDESFYRFIVGQCVEAVILGVLCAMGMWILRFPYALMVGCLVGVTALVPVAGAYLGAAIGAFMILTISPLKAVGFLIFITVLQQVEGNVIYPRVVGKSVGLPGIWVLAAVVIGGGAFGIAGMLVSVPLAATAYRIKEDWICAEEKQSHS